MDLTSAGCCAFSLLFLCSLNLIRSASLKMTLEELQHSLFYLPKIKASLSSLGRNELNVQRICSLLRLTKPFRAAASSFLQLILTSSAVAVAFGGKHLDLSLPPTQLMASSFDLSSPLPLLLPLLLRKTETFCNGKAKTYTN